MYNWRLIVLFCACIYTQCFTPIWALVCLKVIYFLLNCMCVLIQLLLFLFYCRSRRRRRRRLCYCLSRSFIVHASTNSLHTFISDWYFALVVCISASYLVTCYKVRVSLSFSFSHPLFLRFIAAVWVKMFCISVSISVQITNSLSFTQSLNLWVVSTIGMCACAYVVIICF